MYRGYREILWGIFIATFNIKFGIIKILPASVGFLLISMGIKTIYEETKLELFQKAYNTGILIAAMSFIGGIVDYFSYNSIYDSISMSIWSIIRSIIELILFFKILESSIEYLSSNNYLELANDNIGKLRVYTILSILNITIMSFALLFNFYVLISTTAIIGIILRIFMMVLINRLKNFFTGDILAS